MVGGNKATHKILEQSCYGPILNNIISARSLEGGRFVCGTITLQGMRNIQRCGMQKTVGGQQKGGGGGGGVMTSQLTVLEDKEESCCGPSSSRTGLKRSAYFEFCSLVNVRELGFNGLARPSLMCVVT